MSETKTEILTEEQLDSLPKKTLAIMAKELGLTISNRENKDVFIEAILEAQEEELEAEELNAEDEPKTMESKAVKAAPSDFEDQSKQKSMIDINSMSLEDLAALRPDLINKLNKKRVDAVADAAGDNLAAKHFFSVRVGPFGPYTVEAFTRADALQEFQRIAGIVSFTHHKPVINKLGPVPEKTEEKQPEKTEETESK